MLESPSQGACDGRAPDVFRPGEWVPMRSYDDERRGRFRNRRDRRWRRHARLQARGGGLLGRRVRCRARSGDRSKISPPTRREQGGLYWTDERITGGADPVELGANNSGRGVGGSTVHYTMIALRFRPEWFKCTSTARLRPRLADQLRRDRALLRGGRGGAEDLRPDPLPVGQARASAIPIAQHEVNAAGTGARARLRRRSASNGRRCRSRRCRRRAGWRTPASIAASAPTAARPTPSRACWSPSSRARCRPAPKSATWRWSGRIEMGKDGRAHRR